MIGPPQITTSPLVRTYHGARNTDDLYLNGPFGSEIARVDTRAAVFLYRPETTRLSSLLMYFLKWPRKEVGLSDVGPTNLLLHNVTGYIR